MWTQFWDMHSGGGQKLDWPMIYIEAPEEDAKRVFYAVFDRNPERVTCTCCGPDYSISQEDNLAQLTAFHRGMRYVQHKTDKGRGYYIENGAEIPEGFELSSTSTFRLFDTKTLDEYLKTVKVIRADEIKPEWLKVEVPEEGYVWAGDD